MRPRQPLMAGIMSGNTTTGMNGRGIGSPSSKEEDQWARQPLNGACRAHWDAEQDGINRNSSDQIGHREPDRPSRLHFRDGGGDMWRYGQGGTEPTLDEVIHEPVIRLMMERDQVTEEALLRILNIVRQYLGVNHEQQRQETGQLLPNPLLH